MADPKFLRGARPTPRHALLAARPFRAAAAPVGPVAYVPQKLDMWGNDQYGDCVSAEEAFAKACHDPSYFIDTDTVVAWARKHGFLDGAYLTEVMDAMKSDGFALSGTTYNDGPYFGVDYSDEGVLQAAIVQGPVKIAIDANALPANAGNAQGWYAVGQGRFPNTDHCVSISGYGPAGWLYQRLGVALPPNLQATRPGYLLFTWGTIGFVDHAWLLGTCVEAWVRNPTTVLVGPTPQPPTPPAPPTPPTPPTPPQPTPSLFTLTFSRKVKRGAAVSFRAPVAIPAGTYAVVPQPDHAVADVAEDFEEVPALRELMDQAGL